MPSLLTLFFLSFRTGVQSQYCNILVTVREEYKELRSWRARVSLRSIKRSEFVRCVSAFPNVCGNAVLHEWPRRDSETGYDVTDPNSFPQAPAAGGDSQ